MGNYENLSLVVSVNLNRLAQPRVLSLTIASTKLFFYIKNAVQPKFSASTMIMLDGKLYSEVLGRCYEF